MTVTREFLKRCVGWGLALALGLGFGAGVLASVNHRRLGGEAFDLAGEELVRQARRVAAAASPNYQEAALASTTPSPLNGWFLRLDDAIADATEISGETPDWDESRGTLWSLDFEEASELIVVPAGAGEAATVDGWLRSDVSWPASITHEEALAIPVADIGEIQIAVRSAASPQVILGWTTEDEIPREPVSVYGRTIAIDLVRDGQPHLYVVDAAPVIRRKIRSDDLIRRFFLVPNSTPGGATEIDFIKVQSSVAHLAARGTGTSYEAVAGDLRRVVFTSGARQLEFSVTLPEAPVDFGVALAVAAGSSTVQLRVDVVADGARTAVLERRTTPGTAWLEATADLSAFAGQVVRLVLSSSAENDQVALWANPILRSERQRRFNVVLYLDDTLRADHLSVLEYHRDTTPRLRDFAERAVVFEQALAQATTTRPSVASLMTSLPPSATGVIRHWERLGEGYLTLAELMRSNGFVTAAFVQNGNGGAPAGLHQGFGQSLDGETLGGRPGQITEAAGRWSPLRSEQNFFLYVHVLDPHGPYDPPFPDDVWARQSKGGGAAERIARYDGEIRLADRHFGRFMDVLEKLGLREDTLVIFLSDHGEHLGEEGRWGHRPPGDLSVLHVPLLVSYPAAVAGGRRLDVPVQLLDVMPTVLDFAQIEYGSLAITGRSLAGLARTGNPAGLDLRMLVSEEPTDHRLDERGRAVATGSLFFGNWQLQRTRSRGSRWTRWLKGFRPSAAPRGPRDGLLTFDPVTRHRLRALMLEWKSAHTRAWRAFTHADSVAIQVDPLGDEQLRALGYLQ